MLRHFLQVTRGYNNNKGGVKVMKYGLRMKLLVKQRILHSPGEHLLLKEIDNYVLNKPPAKISYKNLALKLVEAKIKACAIEAKRRRWNKKEVRPFRYPSHLHHHFFHENCLKFLTLLTLPMESIISWSTAHLVHAKQPATRRSFCSTSRSTGEKPLWGLKCLGCSC